MTIMLKHNIANLTAAMYLCLHTVFIVILFLCVTFGLLCSSLAAPSSWNSLYFRRLLCPEITVFCIHTKQTECTHASLEHVLLPAFGISWASKVVTRKLLASFTQISAGRPRNVASGWFSQDGVSAWFGNRKGVWPIKKPLSLLLSQKFFFYRPGSNWLLHKLSVAKIKVLPAVSGGSKTHLNACFMKMNGTRAWV